jgi:hypothetical protein
MKVIIRNAIVWERQSWENRRGGLDTALWASTRSMTIA